MSKHAAPLLILTLLIPLLMMPFKPVSAAGDSWTTEAPMQQARSALSVAVVNGKIYAIGGSTLQGSPPYTGGIVGTNEEYDPATDTWVFKTPMPTPRTGFGIAVYNNKIYCIGGEVTYKNDNKPPLTNVNEVYDPATNTWETKEPMPTPRYGMRANIVNGKIYLIGGYDPDISIDSGASTHNEVYDPATDTWSTKTPIPHPTSNYASAVYGDKIYIIGGYIGVGGSRPNPEGLHFELNQVYDTVTDNWTYGAPLTECYGNVAGGMTSGVMAPQRIYVLGTMRTSVGDDPADFFVRAYDPVGDNWTVCARIPTDRWGFGVGVLDDTLYVIGGETAYPKYDINYYSGTPPTITEYATNERYIPIGYGTVPPLVHLVSPHNQTYNASSVSLVFTVNKPVSWMGYSLDGQDNVTSSGNMTLAEVSNGFHNVTVFARDELGNHGVSEIVFFTVEGPSPETFPTIPVLIVIVAGAVVAGAVFLLYRKRGRGKTQ
jgi:N-acetylneuraminic acid mutarotase